MAMRNLLFAGLWLAGLAALGGTLLSHDADREPLPVPQAKASQHELASVVARIDEAFRLRWEDAKVEPAPPADDLTVARRLSLGLAGSVPSLEEIRRLERVPADASAPAVHLEHLLADRRTADYLAERLARALVGDEVGPFLLYRRRRFVSWLADQLDANRPYDDVVRELIGGTGLWTDNPATNFITVSLVQDAGNQPDENKLAGRLCRTFLGIRLDCAQCHDHPFDDEWEQTDFQGLAAFFGPAELGFTGIRDTGGRLKVEDHDLAAEMADLFPRLAETPDQPLDANQKEQDLVRRGQELADRLDADGDERVSRAEFPAGEADLFARLDTGSDDLLAADELADGLAGRRPVDPAVPFYAELWPREGSSREQLAGWITHAENEFFARATVNRIWNLMFGRPLVEPVDDLPPEGPYPVPLEILARDFAANGYDLARLIRLIGASDVFRRDSRVDGQATAEQLDEWAVFPVTRLRPEQVVGGILQSASLRTIDHESHIFVRLARSGGQNEFVRRYGDAGADELEATGGTIPQLLLLMNGQLVHKKIGSDLLNNAAPRIAALAPDDAKAVETAYLAVLTRRPTQAEKEHFQVRLAGTQGQERNKRVGDLYWALINATEFSWNH